MLREFNELSIAVASCRAAIERQLADGQTLRDEWQGHRVASQTTLQESLDAMEQAERKRRAASMRERRAQERDGDPEQQQGQVCGQCGSPHDPRQTCVEAATYRFRQQGHAV